MGKETSTSEKLFLSVIAALGWYALAAQFYLLLLNRVTSVPEAILRYFTFFTILTNILVAVCSTTLLVSPASRWGRYFSKQTVQASIAIYILVVDTVYNCILRFLWAPQGMQKLVDELLHSAIPLLFILYWIIFVRKDQLQWKNILNWLIYPLVYFIVIIARGAFANYYPYPFVDVKTLGYSAVFINSALLTLAFGVVSLLFVGIGKLSAKKTA